MDEQKEENQTEEKTDVDTDKGVQSESTAIIDRADAAAERLEKANAKQEELLKRQEDMAAKQALEGRAEAGQVKEKPKELTDREYAKKFRDGEISMDEVLKV